MGNEVSVCQEPSGPRGEGASSPLLSVSISSPQIPVMSEDNGPGSGGCACGSEKMVVSGGWVTR